MWRHGGDRRDIQMNRLAQGRLCRSLRSGWIWTTLRAKWLADEGYIPVLPGGVFETG